MENIFDIFSVWEIIADNVNKVDKAPNLKIKNWFLELT